MTASEVAAKAGIDRPTVSTTLSRLAKAGEVQKAERGYGSPRHGEGESASSPNSSSPTDSRRVTTDAEEPPTWG